MTRENRKFFLICLLAAVLSAVLLSVCFLIDGSFPGQVKAFVYGDYTDEYLPYFRHFWSALFSGESLEYSFSSGLGTPMLTGYSVFIFSPFSIIPYLVKDVQTAAFLTFVLKAAVSAACFCIFSRKALKSDYFSSLVFSLFYVMSSYMMMYYVNIHFMDIFYILPLMMLALLRLVRKQSVIPLMLCYTYCFINNFFNAYCTGIWSFVIYICLLWYCGIRGKELRKNLGLYFFGVMIALLLSSPVVLPAVFYVFGHMAEGSDFSVIPLQSPLYCLLSFLFGRHKSGIFNDFPALYCGWPTLLFTVAFFLRKERDGRMKLFAAIPLIFLLICTIWHPAYLFMHIFNEPDSFPWRFSYIIIFMLSSLAAYECSNSTKGFGKTLSFAAVLIPVILVLMSYIIYHFTSGGKDYIPLILFSFNLILVALYFFLIHFRKAFFVIAIAELLLAGTVNISTLPDEPFYRQDDIERMMDEDAYVAGKIKDLGESGQQSRWSILNPRGFGYALLHDYKGINFFCSFDNTALWRALYRLGIGARPQCYTDDGLTEFTEMLFSVRFKGGLNEETGYVDIYENELCLPIGFAVSKEILSYSAIYDPFENQQKLADVMLNNDVKLFDELEVLYLPEDCTEETGEGGEHIFIKTGENANISFLAAGKEGQSPYVYLQGDLRSGKNDTVYIISGDPFKLTSQPSVPNLLRFSPTDIENLSNVDILMNGERGSSVVFKDIKGRALERSVLKIAYEELAAGGLAVDHFSDTEIHGRLTADMAHPVMFTSIPYDQGWQIFIDGMETESYPVIDGAFLACDIAPGTHEIQLIYRDQSFILGCEAALIGLLLLVVLVYTERRIRREGEETDSQYRSE